MRFTVAERIHLLQILPREGNIITLRIVSELRKALSFDEADHAKYNFREETVGNDIVTRWDANGETKDVPVGPAALTLIQGLLKALDAAEKLTLETAELYERFEKMTVDTVIKAVS